ncbi:hypothetical protein [Streptomyces sp. H27-H5]|uniref:hypothetical protein n=1 Tax=Streptomyces sp. H27-H5 TaxID=2996460 RepID=UPI002270D4F6|nr:hypothetical protein [Streptomyces sp. H27-H5]MCY0956405.1 hypothetical protein [Streptomyces sp. H27-H5]
MRGNSAGRTAFSARGAASGDAGRPALPPVRPPAGTWLFTGGDGRLTAYACGPDGLLRWTEAAAPASGWTGPERFEVPGWTGSAAMARSREGYVHFAAPVTARDGSGRPEIAVSTQFQSGRALTDWRGLGVPHVRGGPTDDVPTGPPRVAVNQRSGSVHVLVSLRHGGILRCSRNAEGVWGGWKQLSPDPYEGEVTPLMPVGGPLELLALGPAGADRWTGAGQGRFRHADRVPSPVVPGTTAVCETGPRRVTYFWRYPGDGSLVAWRAGEQGLQGTLVGLGDAGGRGAPGVVRTMLGGYDCTVLTHIGADGGVELTAYVTENEAYGTWRASLGGHGALTPQPAVDAAGRIVVAAFDRDGALVLTRQDPAQGLVFGPWDTVGSPQPRPGTGKR